MNSIDKKPASVADKLFKHVVLDTKRFKVEFGVGAKPVVDVNTGRRPVIHVDFFSDNVGISTVILVYPVLVMLMYKRKEVPSND